MSSCDCPICKGRDLNEMGLLFAEKMIFPFVKKQLLEMRFPSHPFPIKYKEFSHSLMAYSQAMVYDIAHNNPPGEYFTSNEFMLKFKDQLNREFPRIIIKDESEMGNQEVREVCEFNVEEQS